MSHYRRLSTDALTTLSAPWTIMDRNFQKMIRVVLPFGCTTSTAIASPILFEYRNVWLTNVLVFFVSSGLLVYQYEEEMKIYGPYTLAFTTVFGIAAYSSARTPLSDLIPWIPTGVWMFVSLTVYFLPKAHKLFTGPMSSEDEAERGLLDRFRRFSVDDTTAQPHAHMDPRDTNVELDWLRGIDRRSVPGLPDDDSIRDSDISLQENSAAMQVALQRGMSIGQACFFTHGIPGARPNEMYPHDLTRGVEGGRYQSSEDEFDLDSSVDIDPSSIVDAVKPLLGK